MAKRVLAIFLAVAVLAMVGCQKEETEYKGETKTATDQKAGEGRQGKGLPQPSLD